MKKVKAVNSNQDTAYASQATYKVETMRVSDDIDPNKNKNSTNNKLHDQGLPSNLNYVDSFHDAAIGTSGTAFRDKTTGEIIVAYTGTNSKGDIAQDVLTDGASIFAGLGYHYDSAYQFYDKMAAKYGSANLTLTGHSLGGNIAQRVALKKNAQNTIVYNAAPLYVPTSSGIVGTLTQNPALALAVVIGSSANMNAIIADQKTFTGKVTRFRTERDPLTKASKAVGGVYIGDDYAITNSGSHSLDDIIDDREQMKQVGAVVAKAKQDSDLKVQKALHTVDDQMKSVQKLKGKYSSGGLTGSEKIFLDTEQASAVSRGLTTVSQEAVTQAASEGAKTRQKAEEIYGKLDDVPFGMVLSPDEVKAAYEEAGCTYDSIVGKIERHCSEKQRKFQELANSFNQLEGSIAQTIAAIVQTDSEIAGMINAK
ncbi:hypothetical protein [Streptococcus macacae]|uniref:DUF2974 domain-containing protein n=1 Tax=Streptococcus macacae NCTC 11558 TaxID=764298 RepID=G5JWV7_9STRE|nr:hypothetical protein [Streptococcus macacae]EHJ52205.1 hypothetical protein STRMA_1254 [Streptococcus macacae NCTC 11558]SUN79132.1 lipase [Streptococcus macacae NCTC 11558]